MKKTIISYSIRAIIIGIAYYYSIVYNVKAEYFWNYLVSGILLILCIFQYNTILQLHKENRRLYQMIQEFRK